MGNFLNRNMDAAVGGGANNDNVSSWFAENSNSNKGDKVDGISNWFTEKLGPIRRSSSNGGKAQSVPVGPTKSWTNITSQLFGKPKIFYTRLTYIILLILYIIAIACFYIYNPYEIASKYFGISIFLSIFLGLFLVMMLSFYNMLYSTQDIANLAENIPLSSNPVFSIFTRVVLIMIGLGMSGFFIAVLAGGVSSLSGYSANFESAAGVGKFILNMIIITVILAISFKILTAGGYFQKSPIYKLIVNTILYIPCILVGIFDFLKEFFIEAIYRGNKKVYLAVIGFIVILTIFYGIPYLDAYIYKKSGTQLINMPIHINKEYRISDYITLNGTDSKEYTYGLSFWVFIEASSPNVGTGSSYETYTSLLNYGGKPNVMYRTYDNTLMITMQKSGIDSSTPPETLNGGAMPIQLDDNGNIIIYKSSDILLQKWNNIVINFNGGTLDIFLNGVLVKSAIDVVPYITYDLLTAGEDNGLNGGICNVMYFKKTLTMNQINSLYNIVKSRNPPVVADFNQSIFTNASNYYS